MNSTTNLQQKLKQMEKVGVSWEDRAATAIDFFESQKRESRFESPSSEPNAAHEELTFSDDASASEPPASRSEPDASRSEPTSDPQASRSEPDANQSEPNLPDPPKFQFGPGNPLYEAALDFRAHRDKRSIFDRLSDTHRDAIIKLLEDYSEYEIAELLAKAPPAGLSIRVSRPALNRFKNRYKKQERQRNSLAFKLETERLLEQSGANDQAFLHASERLLKMRLFEITGDPNANLETIAKLAEVITQLRKQSLAERKHTGAQKNKNEPEQTSNATTPLSPNPP